MTGKVHEFKINDDQPCPRCGKGGSVNGGLCLKCASDQARDEMEEVADSLLSSTDILDPHIIAALSDAIRRQLIRQAKLASQQWRKKRSKDIRVMACAITLKDDQGQPKVTIDFGYTQKIKTSFAVNQPQIPGM